MSKSVTNILMLVFALLIVYLGYLTFVGIKGPVEFDKESKLRYTEVENKLDAIRNVQFAIRQSTGKYANSWDSLGIIVNQDSLTIQRKLLIPKDKYDVEQYGEDPVLADDTTKYEVTFMSRVALKDTLAKSIKYDISKLHIIPFSGGESFYLNADIIDAGGGRLKVPVFIVTAPNRLILKGLNEKFFNPDAGYKMGSMYETTTEFGYSRDAVDYE